VRNGVKSMPFPSSTTASPVPPGLVGCIGPVALFHQLSSALMVSVPRYWAPVALPAMLF
jgi:hypothetical protein